MKKIGIFFGSDTGNTENVAKNIQQNIGTENSFIYDIEHIKKKDIELFDILIFGVSTWYYGELQCDWDDFFSTFKKINFNKKILAFFGCGDQEDYAEYFCDAIGILYNSIKQENKFQLIGTWPIEGYSFECSKALMSNKNKFIGLTIDEDRQPEKSKKRIKQWSTQLKKELKVFI